MGRTIRSKVSDGTAYQDGFDRLKRRRGSGICKGCHRYPCRCRGIVLDRAEAVNSKRGGRARMVTRSTPMPVERMNEELKAATRVLALAESPKERDMFRSLLETEGRMCSREAIRDGMVEARLRRSF